MALAYKVLTEEQDKMRNLVPAGQYAFLITKVEEKRTKNGKYDMLELSLSLWDIDGRERKLRDWVVLMDEMDWKLRHLAATCGLLDRYEDQLLEARDFMDKKGVVKIGLKDSQNEFGEMIKTNSVVDYIKPSLNAVAANAAHPAEPFNDDIKF